MSVACVEASEIGLPPGSFPSSIVHAGRMLVRLTTTRDQDGDIVSVQYGVAGTLHLTVLND